MKLFLKLLTFILFCFAVAACNAQFNSQTNFKFISHTTLQGLADNVVVKSVKDKNGFLWIATHNGISRFDGLNYKNYTYSTTDTNSLRSIWISDLVVDNQNTIWASTEGGLCYYNPSTNHFKYINAKENIRLVYKIPMYLQNNTTLWIAAEDGLKKVNTITKNYTSTSLNRIADPQFIVQDANNNLLIGTRGKGLYKYNINNNTFKLLKLKNVDVQTHFMGALQDDNITWIATDVGLLQLNTNEIFKIFNSSTAQLNFEKITELMCVSKFKNCCGKNKLLCGTYNKKLFLFDKTTNSFTYQWLHHFNATNDFLPSVLYSFFEDDNIFWMSSDRGLIEINLNVQQQQSFIINQLQNNDGNTFVKKAIQINDNNIWLIPWQPYYGLLNYNTKSETITKEFFTKKSSKKFKYNDIIQSVINKNIIAVRDSAIDIFSPTKGFLKSIKINEILNCIQEDKDGNLWIGSENGIYFVNLKINNFKNYTSNFKGSDFEKNIYGGKFPIADIKLGEANTLWMANIKYGLFSFNTLTKKFIAHRQKNTEQFSTLNRCKALQITNSDSIWIGNFWGLSCYIPSIDSFINYNSSNGLKSTYIYSVVKDSSNNLVCLGNADLFYFNTKNKSIISTPLNPLYSPFVFNQQISLKSNNIFLGHEGGFTQFNLLQFVNPIKQLPNLQIDVCKINGQTQPITNSSINSSVVHLKYFQNQISFDFTAIENNNSNAIEYYYRLVNAEKNWINNGNQKSVTYNFLKPAKYIFEVYAFNKQNNTRSAIKYFLFTIHPALWQQWWFWPVIALLFIMVVFIIAIKYITIIKQKEKQKTALNKTMAELETKMLRSQMNPHFIFNSLNSIQKYIWENKEEDAAEYLARFAKLIRAILENSIKEFITLKEEMEVMKLYIDLEHRRSNGRFEYTIKIDKSIHQEKTLIPPLLMQPFIENAIWHGLNKKEIKGNLLISVEKKTNHLICIIDDNGVGRQQKNNTIPLQKKSLGIEITQQRINRLVETTNKTASVHIFDKIQNGKQLGTTVTLTLPLQTQL